MGATASRSASAPLVVSSADFIPGGCFGGCAGASAGDASACWGRVARAAGAPEAAALGPRLVEPESPTMAEGRVRGACCGRASSGSSQAREPSPSPGRREGKFVVARGAHAPAWSGDGVSLLPRPRRVWRSRTPGPPSRETDGGHHATRWQAARTRRRWSLGAASRASARACYPGEGPHPLGTHNACGSPPCLPRSNRMNSC